VDVVDGAIRLVVQRFKAHFGWAQVKRYFLNLDSKIWPFGEPKLSQDCGR